MGKTLWRKDSTKTIHFIFAFTRIHNSKNNWNYVLWKNVSSLFNDLNGNLTVLLFQ